MRWFRLLAVLMIMVTLMIAVSMAAGIIAMCTSSGHKRAMESDPNYNGTLGIYVVIIIIQFGILSSAIFGFIICFKNWKNNYQMDFSLRHQFITWLSLWGLCCLTNVGVAMYAIIRGKEPQEEMAAMYEVFAKGGQDSRFVSHFERYQRENSCCGIYGPDDWLMVQLRSGMGGGGGGGGFQSLDYGFRQNPGTGNCHLTPPTIPMGCGRRILEEVHVLLDTFAGLMILETLIAIIAGSLAGYCFFYWLDKEVIVIPEDEVSNLIVLEPESSTSTTTGRNNGGYIHSGSHPFLGPPQDNLSRAPPYASRSRGGGPSYMGSRRVSVITTKHTIYNPTRQPSHIVRFASNNGGNASIQSHPNPANPPGSIDLTTGLGSGGPGVQTRTMALLSAAGPFDAGSRPRRVSTRALNTSLHRASYIPQGHSYPPHLGSQGLGTGSRGLGVGSRRLSEPPKPHSAQHMLHKQEKALGGRLLGEMHVDHSKDADPENENLDGAKGKHGHKTHHATIALVRNKKAPKPKQILADNDPGKGHHGQTGHLAEDIAEMTGNTKALKEVLDDVVLPVEHNPGHLGSHGGYLNALEHRKHEEAARRTSTVAGVEAQNIISHILEPVAAAHAHGHSLEDEERPLIKPHFAGGSQEDQHLHHQHGGYLPMGVGSRSRSRHLHVGSHEDAHYLHTGSHENAHYIHMGSREDAHYPHAGSHEHAHYINPGSHEDAHYLHTGSHEDAHYLHTGSHEDAHYLHTGSHENAHYLPTGSHENAHYLHTGSHENAHYFHRGEHENAHYMPRSRSRHSQGRHEDYPEDGHGSHHHHHDPYLPAGGSHEHGHGSHEHTHYLPTGRRSHEHDHEHHHGSGHSRVRGNHSRALYLQPSHTHPHNHHQQQHDPSHHHMHHNGSHERGHYLPVGHNNGSVAHYLPLNRMANNSQHHHHNMHRSGGHQEHLSHRVLSRRHFTVRTEILYKNPKPIDDTD